MDWAVGITTAPRKRLFLDATWNSARAAGWESAVAFAEPGSPQPELPGLSYVTHREKQGAWRNWRGLLTHLARRADECELVMMIQDDVAFRPGLRKFLEETVSPTERTIYSPYTCNYFRNYFSKRQGWVSFKPGFAMIGALTYVFNRDTLLWLERTLPQEVKRNQHIDAYLGLAMKEARLPIYTHIPSLAQHLADDCSSLGYKRDPRIREASDFVAEPIQPAGRVQ